MFRGRVHMFYNPSVDCREINVHYIEGKSCLSRLRRRRTNKEKERVCAGRSINWRQRTRNSFQRKSFRPRGYVCAVRYLLNKHNLSLRFVNAYKRMYVQKWQDAEIEKYIRELEVEVHRLSALLPVVAHTHSYAHAFFFLPLSCAT